MQIANNRLEQHAEANLSYFNFAGFLLDGKAAFRVGTSHP